MRLSTLAALRRDQEQDGSRDDQAGEAGLVEQSSAEAKSLKLRAKGLVRTTEAARRGARGPK